MDVWLLPHPRHDPGPAATRRRTHAAARRLLAGYLRRPPADVRWVAAPCPVCGGPHGRPELPAASGVHFSLSHTSGLAVLAVHDRPVGVDVERTPPGGAAADEPLLRRALHPRERVTVGRLPSDERGLAFLHCWVRKEAVLKATGHGLAREPDTLAVGPGPRFGWPTRVPGGWTVHPVGPAAATGPAPPRIAAAGGVVGAVAVRSSARATVLVRWDDLVA